LRIAIWHNLPSGGGKRALHDQVKGLLERGHVVESWCPPTADQTYLPLGKLIPELVVPLDWAPHREKGFRSRFAGSYQDIVSHLRAMDEHCMESARQINKGGFDVFFGNSCRFFRTTSIARFVDGPKVLYLQEPFRWLYEALPQLPWLARPVSPQTTVRSVYRLLKDIVRVQGLRIQAREEVESAKAYNRILVNSFFSRESVLRAYGVNATVCYLGIDTETFVYERRPREPFVVSLGSMTAEKNARFVIEAISRLREPRPPLVWIANLVGGAYANEMKELAASLGVHFEIRHQVSDSELVDLLNRATAMLYAPRLEPFGMAPLEANACGLPVIAVAEGGVRETIVHGVNGLLVDGDPNAMARAIQSLLNDSGYARALGESAVRLVNERWSLKAAHARLEDILQLAVSSSP